MTIAVVLAGGLGRRVGGGKPTLPLAGRPLVSYPLAALRAAGLDPVVVAKPSTPLPELDALVIHEAHARLHPFAGVLAALDHAHGAPVLVVAADMPFVTPVLLRVLAQSEPRDASVVLPVAGGRLHPLCARYGPAAREAVAAALAAEAPVLRTVMALDPVQVAADEAELFNVNTPEDLQRAEAMLREPTAPAPPRPPSSK